MHRRLFITGTLAAAAAALAARALGRGARPPGAGGLVPERLPDGRVLASGAAVAFGTTVSISVVHGDGAAARDAIREALRRVRAVDALMTVYRPESAVSRLNAEGELRAPDPHLVRVLERSQALAAASEGAFDPTVQPLWLLHVAARRAARLPAPDELEAARARVGWTALEVSPRRIRLARRGASITLNGIAQGYAADLALDALRERGIHDALVDAGEHGAEGVRRPGAPWTVGIRHPRDPAALAGAVRMDGRFLSVSGDYATRFSEDLLQHHVFDPRTGRSPAGVSAVAVLAPRGIDADALTKPMMVLPRDRACALLDRFPDAGAAWFDERGRLVATHRMAILPPEAVT